MMTIVVQSGQDHYYRYLTSKSGKNGTWTIKNRSAFSAGGNPGNMCFWKEGAQWHMLYEWLSAGKWVTSYAYGPALDSLTKYNEGKPVMSGACMVGGPDVVKSGSVYYMFGHAAEHSGGLPTSATCYTSHRSQELDASGMAFAQVLSRKIPGAGCRPFDQGVQGKNISLVRIAAGPESRPTFPGFPSAPGTNRSTGCWIAQ